MTIRRSNADIPDGWHPDPEPRFVHLLAEKWAAEDAEAGERPHAIPGTRFRHSDAGGCARKLAYKAAGIPRTDPMDLTGSWNTRLGTLIHDEWQKALQERYPQAEIEVTSQAFNEGSGSMDALIRIEVGSATDRPGDDPAVHGQDRDGAGLLEVDRGAPEVRTSSGRGLRSVRGGGEEGTARPSDRMGNVRRTDPEGPGDRPPLSEPGLRQPPPSGGGDGPDQHPAGDGVLGQERRQDTLPERSPVGGRQSAGQAGATGVHDVRAQDEARRVRTISYELKTVGGYSYKASVGKIRRGTPPEGPKHDHIIQAALNGLAHDADEVVIGYLAKETLSKNYDDVPDLGKFCAEWTLTREQYEPIARLEIQRVEGILDLLDEGLLAARKVPGTPGEIVDPTTSRWEQRDSDDMMLDTGSVWNGSFCKGYCSHFGICVLTQPGRVDVETVVKLREAMP